MGEIVYEAICDFAINFVLFSVILPLAIIFFGYLIYILIMTFKEIKKK